MLLENGFYLIWALVPSNFIIFFSFLGIRYNYAATSNYWQLDYHHPFLFIFFLTGVLDPYSNEVSAYWQLLFLFPALVIFNCKLRVERWFTSSLFGISKFPGVPNREKGGVKSSSLSLYNKFKHQKSANFTYANALLGLLKIWTKFSQ